MQNEHNGIKSKKQIFMRLENVTKVLKGSSLEPVHGRRWIIAWRHITT